MPDAIGASGAPGLLGTGQTIDPALLQQRDQFGKDTFLKLMVAQLKYQNPTSPMDSSEFMSQTAQFTTVEKLSELTEKLTESLQNDQLATATGMIGRRVTYAGVSGQDAVSRVSRVRFTPTGPQLVLADGSEVGLGQVKEVAAST